jgi:hypothetical protein
VDPLTIECDCGATLTDDNPLNPIGEVLLFHYLAGHKLTRSDGQELCSAIFSEPGPA